MSFKGEVCPVKITSLPRFRTVSLASLAGAGRGGQCAGQRPHGERTDKALSARPPAGTPPEAVIHCHRLVLNYQRRHGQTGITVPSARLLSALCPHMLSGESVVYSAVKPPHPKPSAWGLKEKDGGGEGIFLFTRSRV